MRSGVRLDVGRGPVVPVSIPMRWQHASGRLEIQDRPLLMGILNVTPDSFSDGGCFYEPDRAVEHGLKLLEDGAAILDIGGESTRPGAVPLAASEELARVLPVVEGILREKPGTIISIDTYKAETARGAMGAGASIINDVGGLCWDEGMLAAVIDSGAGYIGMHSKGRPAVMQQQSRYRNVVDEVGVFLDGLRKTFAAAGLAEDRLVLDVGIGFGKNVEHNMALLKAGERWADLQRPLVWGVSKKSFISRVLGVEERLAGGMAVHAWLRSRGGPQIWRVHEIRETRQFLDMWDLLV